MKRIYLDYNATCPVHPAEVRQRIDSVLRTDGLANPSSVHAEGRAARRLVERARREVADWLDASPHEIVFVASGAEANATAIAALAAAAEPTRRHVVASAIEHPCVDGALRALARRGWEVTRVRPGPDGIVRAEAFVHAVRPETALAVLMAANHETGALQPIAEVAAALVRTGVPLHVDAVQWAPWSPHLHPGRLGVATLATSAHKLGGLPGAGALWVAPGRRIEPLVPGHQERGRRGGTEAVLAVVAMGAAVLARRAALDNSDRLARVDALRRGLLAKLRQRIGGLEVATPLDASLPNTLCVLVEGARGDALVAAADLAGVALSAGAACASGSTRPSEVLLAQGFEPRRAASAIRLSLGLETTSEEVERAADILARVIASVRAAHATARQPLA